MSAGCAAFLVPMSREHLVACIRPGCADSAVIDADPVTTAATVFATAIRRFALNARMTVRRLSSFEDDVFSGDVLM